MLASDFPRDCGWERWLWAGIIYSSVHLQFMTEVTWKNRNCGICHWVIPCYKVFSNTKQHYFVAVDWDSVRQIRLLKRASWNMDQWNYSWVERYWTRYNTILGRILVDTRRRTKSMNWDHDSILIWLNIESQKHVFKFSSVIGKIKSHVCPQAWHGLLKTFLSHNEARTCGIWSARANCTVEHKAGLVARAMK